MESEKLLRVKKIKLNKKIKFYRVKICSDLLWRQHKKNNALSYGITAANFQNYHSPNWPEHHVTMLLPIPKSHLFLRCFNSRNQIGSALQLSVETSGPIINVLINITRGWCLRICKMNFQLYHYQKSTFRLLKILSY